MCINNLTHFPPVPYWYTFKAVSICIVGVMSYICTHVFNVLSSFAFPSSSKRASTSAPGEDNSASRAIAKRKTILLMPRKSVSKAEQDAFEHICGQWQIVVERLSDRQRPVLQSNTLGDPHTIQPRMLCSVRAMYIALLHGYMYACACPSSIPSVREQNNAYCRWYMRTCRSEEHTSELQSR